MNGKSRNRAHRRTVTMKTKVFEFRLWLAKTLYRAGSRGLAASINVIKVKVGPAPWQRLTYGDFIKRLEKK